jgi:hypothetical protein
MSPEMVERIYGHHHPGHMRTAAEAIGRRKSEPQSLVISLADAQRAKGNAL